ncbi:hypothetical protein [Arthrobacter sp. A2-55]|uniref:hypothetical protein n=1 Tax=Arthrobacter sp. A2-55 TaxID=2897337 RepID=UPI0021CDC7EF|nr:hypothetical protein [Arthrobacter sp. A2-55]MCU6481051.1 hypothetical protein [Arthrobacter sp. A2-55]
MAALVAIVLSGYAWTAAGAQTPAPPGPSAPSVAVHPDSHRNVTRSLAGHRHQAVCAPATRGHASCDAVKDLDVGGPLASASTVPYGYAPSDLQAAYKLPAATAGAGVTVAVVDAYDDPTAESDLAAYRAKFGLPGCTASNGCFAKVDQRGGAAYPHADAGWSTEISLDLDMVSAACPLCNILLVEADTTSIADLGAAVNMAVAKGAVAVSNSYGTPSSSLDSSFDGYYNHPGVAVTASAGDTGYGAEYPAASAYVTAVGGTSLSRDASARGWAESAWSGSGSGCSYASTKPAWQADAGCTTRTVTDVSAVADPGTGLAVYSAATGWTVVGGTSASAPLIAAVYAMAGVPPSGSNPAQFPYLHAGQLNDVVTGSNGSCSGAYLCSSTVGYDGPTGLGTPAGVSAFAGGAAQPTPTPTPTPSPTPTPVPSPPVHAITSLADTVYANPSGLLFDVPAAGAEKSGPARQIGHGFTNIRDMHVTDWNSDGVLDLLVQWNSGRVNVYLGAGGGLAYGPVIASQGWQGVTLTVGKWSTKAPYPWLVGTNSAGGLYYWANPHGTTVQTAVKIGNGWTGLKITQLDFDADGRPDLLVRQTSGAMLLYRGNGTGQIVYETRRVIGSGWQGYDALSPVFGFARPGSRGLVARNISTGTRYYYPVYTGYWGPRIALSGNWQKLTLAD